MKIVIVPGFVTNKYGEHVFVDQHQLMNLYDVPRRLCIVWDPLLSKGPRPDPTWPHLYPCDDGEYKLTPEAQKVIDDDSASIPG